MIYNMLIEKENCFDCGGSGEIGHPDDPNGRCAKCRGSGSQLTKRGQVVQDKWTAMCTIPARKLRAGMRIMFQTHIFTVDNIDFTSISQVVWLTTTKGDDLQLNFDERVIFYPDDRQREDMIIELIRFRESLLKSGQVKKKRKQ
jgi:hypothetical protein